MATNETGQVEWDAANCLRVDHATVEAVDALRAAGVRPVLQKGPVIAQWLYADDPSQRAYNDTDLLVAPDDLAPAAEVLDGLGYRPVAASGLRFRHQVPRQARCWFRDRDRAAIDLHRTIHGTERLDPALVWGAAVEQPETVDVLGTRMEVPGEPFRLLHLVLHIRPKDHPGSRAWTDLERAVDVISDDRWRGAVRLAERLGVAGSTGPLLRLSDRGGELADRLGLPRRWPSYLRLQYGGDGTTAARFAADFLQIAWPDRVRLAVEWVAPPPDHVRRRWPLAATGPSGLAIIYVTRLVLVPWRAVQMLRTTRTRPRRRRTVPSDRRSRSR